MSYSFEKCLSQSGLERPCTALLHRIGNDTIPLHTALAV